jgi:hypothetical protein
LNGIRTILRLLLLLLLVLPTTRTVLLLLLLLELLLLLLRLLIAFNVHSLPEDNMFKSQHKVRRLHCSEGNETESTAAAVPGHDVCLLQVAEGVEV